MQIVDDRVIMQDGTEYTANGGIIGLTRSDGEWEVTEGFDGGFPPLWGQTLSVTHRVELAEYMVELWTQYGKEHTVLALRQASASAFRTCCGSLREKGTSDATL